MQDVHAQVARPDEIQEVRADNDNSPNAISFDRGRRAPQDEAERKRLLMKYDNALARLGRIEASAGPSLRRDLGRSKRVQAAYSSGAERKGMVLRRLGQRAGLFRLMRRDLGDDPAVTDRARLYMTHMLRAAANVAALTGSRWPSVRGWLQSRLPAIMGAIGPAIEADFAVFVAEAQAELARRIPSGDPNLHTGPTPGEIAEALSVTEDQLRQVRANRCGLTSIAPQDRLTRDRERKARDRRRAGMKPQAERTAVADMKALADRLGCSLSTIQRRRRDGTLDAFIASHEGGDHKVSTDIREINGGQILVTPLHETLRTAA